MSDSILVANYVKYTLMHKNVPVLDMTLEDDLGQFKCVDQVHNLDHAPFGTVRYGQLDEVLLKKWWNHRSIPTGRDMIESFLMKLRLSNPKALLTKSMGLSLSDQYWIKPPLSEIRWEDVNFFENDFSDDIGDILFGHPSTGNVNMVSPDNTSDGVLRKRWKIVNGKRCLLKSSPSGLGMEAYGEVIASILCKALDIPHVEYTILEEEAEPICICEDFIDSSTELVNAASVLNSYTHLGPMTQYQEYVNACRQLGFDVVPFLDRMIVLDYIIENHDRHFGNFGIIRNAETLEVLGPAPIYDSGSSLRCKSTPFKFWSKQYGCEPFVKTFDEQIKLVKTFDWIDFNKLYQSLDDVEGMLDRSSSFHVLGLDQDILDLLDTNISKIRSIAENR